jgi:hypothetical protein
LNATFKNSPISKATFPPWSGQALIRTRPHRIRLTTGAGEVCITSVYGQDPQSGRWLCPLREAWGLSARQELSPVLEERLCFTATLTGSYEAAARVAGKWGSPADDTTIHAHVQRAGARAAALAATRVERALDPATRGEVVAEAQQTLGEQPFSLVIEMDGWMVRERETQWGLKPPEKQGERVAWHEMKTAIVFRLDQRAQTQSGRPTILEKFYVAHRGEPHEFGRRLYGEALRRGLNQAERVYVVADGGVWIWNIVADRFGEATGVLDFYHASEHLWAVARAIHDDEERARRWVEPLLHQLKHGGQDQVLRRLGNLVKRSEQYEESVEALIKTEANYFVRHRDHLRYQQVEGEGCPKGSGAMESTCSQFQDRFKRTGQFWSLPGEHCLLALELARRNEDWDEIWELAA